LPEETGKGLKFSGNAPISGSTAVDQLGNMGRTKVNGRLE
jgi:hypothetical protein